MQHLRNLTSQYVEFFLESFKPYIYFLKTDPIARYLFAAVIILALILAIIPRNSDKKSKTATDFTPNDINTIACEDIVSTQLDLAKAYIEMDNRVLAKKMLKIIARQGNQTQKKEAKQLMKAL